MALTAKRIYELTALAAAITGYEFALDKNGIPFALKVSFDDLNALIIHDNLKDIDAGATYLHLDSDEKGLVQDLDAQVVANVATLPVSGNTSLLYYAIAEQLLKYWDGVNYQDIIDFNNVAKKNAANTFTELNIFDHIGDKKAAIQIGDLTTVSSITGVYGRTTTEMWVSGATGAEVVVGQSAGAIELARFKSAGLEVAGYVAPSTDNNDTCGTASNRWTEIFSVNPVINTSDGDLKTIIAKVSEKEKQVARLLKAEILTYKWNDAIDLKGDGARIHIGVIAQTVRDILLQNELDPNMYSFYCYNEWEEEVKITPEHIEKFAVLETVSIRKTEIVQENGRYVQKSISENIEQQKIEKHKLYNEKGEIIGNVDVPVFNEVLVPEKREVIREAGSTHGIRPVEVIWFIMASLT